MKRKNLFLITVITIMVNLAYSQPAIQWQKCLGGTLNEYAHSIQQTADGGYIVAGLSHSNDGDVTSHHGLAILTDYWIVKLNSSGNLQWQKNLGGTNAETAYAIQQTTDGGYIVAGQTSSNADDVSGNHGTFDYWIVKLDTGGTIQWQKCLGGTNPDRAYTISQTSDGGYIAAGSAASNNGDITGNHGGGDAWIVKLDNNGNLQWQKSLGGTALDEARSVVQTSDGGYIIAGATASNDGDVMGNHSLTINGLDCWIVKLDSTGSFLWQKCLGGSADETAWSIQQTSDGGFMVAGITSSIDGDVFGNHGGSDYWIVKLDGLGAILWQKCLGGSAADAAYSIHRTLDGGYIIAGYSLSNNGNVAGNHGSIDFWLVKILNNGDIVWQKCLGGTSDETASSSQPTSDGGYVIAGYTLSNNGNVSGNHGQNDFWVVKLAPDDVGIEEENINSLFSISPNPFATNATIKFNKEITAGTLRLYDMYGQMVFEKNNINGKEIVINEESISSGVYVVEITEKEKIIYTGKAVVY